MDTCASPRDKCGLPVELKSALAHQSTGMSLNMCCPLLNTVRGGGRVRGRDDTVSNGGVAETMTDSSRLQGRVSSTHLLDLGSTSKGKQLTRAEESRLVSTHVQQKNAVTSRTPFPRLFFSHSEQNRVVNGGSWQTHRATKGVHSVSFFFLILVHHERL